MRKKWSKKTAVRLSRYDADTLTEYFEKGVPVSIPELQGCGVGLDTDIRISLCSFVAFLTERYADELRKHIRESGKDKAVPEVKS